jgi:hypothetical protein
MLVVTFRPILCDSHSRPFIPFSKLKSINPVANRTRDIAEVSHVQHG